ncbi:MAG: sugar phosphate isomerase/epimerase family protein [Opitutaceae bacterium]
MTTPSRRRFLQLSGAAALLAAAPASPFAAPAVAATPSVFGRKGASRMLLSLAAYSFRDYFPVMRGKPNPKVPAGRAIDMARFVDYCAEQGCDGAELTSYFFTEETDAYILALRRTCFLRGMSISGTAIGNNFSHPPGPKHAAEIAATKQWIDRAALLGAPHIRVFAGVTNEWPRDQADRQVVQALEEVCDYAGKRGIFLGLENHDSIGSAATLLPMVKAVKSPWIGVNLDSGNFRTDDPYRDFAECVPYAVNVQFKVELSHTAAGGSRPADLKRLVKLLRDGGYQGWVALEYEAKEDPWVAVPRYLAEMRALIGA